MQASQQRPRRGGMASIAVIASALLLVLLQDAGVNAARTRAVHDKCGALLGSDSDTLPVSKDGWCGLGLAVCPAAQCCDQYGTCGTTCQCTVSGKKSACDGNPLITEELLPVTVSAGVCGPFTAHCPKGECCSVWGYCDKLNCVSPDCLSTGAGEITPCKTPGRGTYTPVTRNYDLEFSLKAVNLDGFEREGMVVNGETPGPVIECNVGDRVLIKVKNSLGEPTSMHWHGLLQRGTNTMDGVPGITQAGIPDGGEMLYDFHCDERGTFWYHSHFKSQYIDGLKGSFVVYDPLFTREMNLDVEAFAQLSDWYHNGSAVLSKLYLNGKKNPDGDEPIPISGLVNGVGCYNSTDAATDVYTAQSGQPPYSNKCDFSVLPATKGSCDKPSTVVRIFNQAGFARFYFSIDSHRMKIIAMDGQRLTESEPVDTVWLNAGQRVVVYLCPDEGIDMSDGTTYWVRSQMDQTIFNGESPNPQAYALLEYGPKKGRARYTVSNSKTKLPYFEASSPKDASLVFSEIGNGSNIVDPYTNNKGVTEQQAALSAATPQTPPDATRTFEISIALYQDPTNTSVNWAHFAAPSPNITFAMPNHQVMHSQDSLISRLLKGDLPPSENFGMNILSIKEGDVVDFIVNNNDGGQHPLHLHGHWFYVMARGQAEDGNYRDDVVYDNNPILRDTVTVESNSYIVLRFIADNPGAWVFHCHIDWHLEAGLMLVIQYGLGLDPKD